MKGLMQPHTELTAKVPDLRLQRQNYVIGNITNVHTPRYRPRKLEFEQDLQAALGIDARGKMTKTEGGHLPSTFNAESFKGTPIKEFQPRVIYGEDSVDLDKEMTTLAKNAMLYNALTEVIKKDFEGVNKIIMDSKA